MYVYSCGDTEHKIGSMREIGAKGHSAFVQMNLSGSSTPGLLVLALFN